MNDNDGRWNGACESCCSPLHGFDMCPHEQDVAGRVRSATVEKSPAKHILRHPGSLNADAKRGARRARRRMEKLDPENAPTRLRELTRGWAD